MAEGYLVTAKTASEGALALAGFEAGNDIEAKLRAGAIVSEALQTTALAPSDRVALTQADRLVTEAVAGRFVTSRNV